MSTILLVEDDPRILDINRSALMIRGYKTLSATSLKNAKEILDSKNVDLIVLDIMLPDGNGIDFCKLLKSWQSAPVIFLSALGESADIVAGLRAGGDDYLAKPYDLEILIARIEARLRSVSEAEHYIFYSGLKLDTLSCTAYLADNDLCLTPKEFAVLLLLCKYAENIIPSETIYRTVWGQPMNEDTRALWTVISRLNKKLSAVNSGIIVASKRSDGYIIEQI